MPNDQVDFIFGSVELIDRVKPLWEKLNMMHAKTSTYFSESFQKFKFSDRKSKLVEKNESMLIVLARDSVIHRDIGYVIATVDKNLVGEIDSLYLAESHRGRNIGGQLIEKALDWLKRNSVAKIKLAVAVGNEDVINLYKRYNFYPEAIILEYKK